MVLFDIAGPSIEYQYPIRDISVVLCSIPNIAFKKMILCYSNLSLVRSAFIDPDTCPWVLFKIVCGAYKIRHTYFLTLLSLGRSW